MKQTLFRLAVLLLTVCPLLGQSRPTAFINARIIPVIGQPIEQGILVVQNVRITVVGDGRPVRLSGDVQTIDVAGKVIMPGLVDSHSHIGEGADGSGPIQSDVRLLDGINARASSLQRAQAGGIAICDGDPFEYTSHCIGAIKAGANRCLEY